MAKKQIKPYIIIDDEYFTPEKMNDVFKEVEFTYQTKQWQGALPKFLEKQGLDLTDKEFDELLEENYQLLEPANTQQWIVESDARWKNKNTETYKVLAALYTGEWECRTCGIGRINDQPPARIKVLKVMGYIICSRRRNCPTCDKKTMHDILLMLPPIESRFEHGNELRKPMSDILKKRIKKLFGNREVCFNIVRGDIELLIDHKFPSQRWNAPESDNPNDMSDEEIRSKFQLLSNQTNMWKSRYCDACVKTGKRGDFMGLNWYYAGNENWQGASPHDENGCKGCPWYDLELWKAKLAEKTNG
jgi:rubrerythrin